MSKLIRPNRLIERFVKTSCKVCDITTPGPFVTPYSQKGIRILYGGFLHYKYQINALFVEKVSILQKVLIYIICIYIYICSMLPFFILVCFWKRLPVSKAFFFALSCFSGHHSESSPHFERPFFGGKSGGRLAEV